MLVSDKLRILTCQVQLYQAAWPSLSVTRDTASVRGWPTLTTRVSTPGRLP